MSLIWSNLEVLDEAIRRGKESFILERTSYTNLQVRYRIGRHAWEIDVLDSLLRNWILVEEGHSKKQGKNLGAHRAHRSPGVHPLAMAVLAYLTSRPCDAALRCIPGLPRLNRNGSAVRTACLPRRGKLNARSVSSVNNDETVTKFQL
jgi:hypothetical protein